MTFQCDIITSGNEAIIIMQVRSYLMRKKWKFKFLFLLFKMYHLIIPYFIIIQDQFGTNGTRHCR